MTEEKVSILLVDDHIENLVALEALLSDLGENLVRAQSGTDALRLLLHQEFAVIILDVDMPIIDGFETAALIREREKSAHKALDQVPHCFVAAAHRPNLTIAVSEKRRRETTDINGPEQKEIP